MGYASFQQGKQTFGSPTCDLKNLKECLASVDDFAKSTGMFAGENVEIWEIDENGKVGDGPVASFKLGSMPQDEDTEAWLAAVKKEGEERYGGAEKVNRQKGWVFPESENQ